jgi:hypothetical protein
MRVVICLEQLVVGRERCSKNSGSLTVGRIFSQAITLSEVDSNIFFQF